MEIHIQKALIEIKELLISFSRYIEIENSNGEFGINKIAENILAGLLEIVFDCELQNLNMGHKNFPGIDLGDENRKIAFQISSESTRKKILETLNTIKIKKLYLQFCNIYIYLLGEKRKYKKLQASINEVVGNEFIFSENQILDRNDIYSILGNCQDLNKIYAARDYLKSHFDVLDVHKSLEEQIWNAGEEELRLMLEEGRFFASVSRNSQEIVNGRLQGISEKLFPRGFMIPQYYEGYGVSEEGAMKPLSNLYKDHVDNNLILLGEGGIGKTTFLIHLMKSFYEKKDYSEKIPVYIELNRCPPQIGMWYSSRYKKTNFVTRYIATMLDGGDYCQVKEERINQIEEELRKKTVNGEVRYLLFLDGFNEVSRNQTVNEYGNTGQSIRETLRREISVLCTYGNIKMILTSRRMDRVYLPDGFEALYLTGLSISDIRNYLLEVNYSEVEINEIEISQELVGCLQIPLFLCMFAARNQNKKIRPLTRGEILYNFFHKDSPFYGEQKNIKTTFSRNYNEQMLLSFIMDFILPYIGSMMEGTGEFHVSRSDIINGIEYFLQDEEIPFWNTEIEVFREYERETCLNDVVSEIRNISARQIMDCMVGTLGILIYDGKEGYSFIHHHVRDYFASIYEIQWLRCAVALRNKELKKEKEPSDQVLEALGSIRYETWSEIKQIFVGEILSENRNAPLVDDQGKWCHPQCLFPEQLLLKHVLDIFRNTQVYPGRCICNIIEILKQVRKNLSGEDFSGLDLRDCRFYETVCSVGEGEEQMAASFQNAILSDDTFYFEGHLGGYEDFEIFYDKAYTLGADGRVLIWDLESYQCRKSFEVGNSFYPDTHIENCQIVVGKEIDFLVKHYEYFRAEYSNELIAAEIRCYNQMTQEYISMNCPDVAMGIWDMGYSMSGNFVISVWEDNYVGIYDRYDGRIIYSFQATSAGGVRHIAMPEDNIIILHVTGEEESDEDRICKSMWFFEKVSLPDMKYEKILSYETKYSFNNEYQRPAFSFSISGWEALIFEGSKVKIVDLKNGTKSDIQEIPDGKTPETVCFINAVSKYACIHYDDNYAIWDLSEDSHAIFSNKILEAAKKVAYGMDKIYVLDRAVELNEWDFAEDKVRKIFPPVELNVLGITNNEALNEVCIQYSNNSFLIVDKRTEKLKASIFYPEYNMEMEFCEYLIQRQLLFMVLASEECEEIVLYSLETGQSRKIHVNFKSRLHFSGIIVSENEILISFNKKVVEISLTQLTMYEVWNAEEGEELLGTQEKDGKVSVLIKKKNSSSIPFYHVYRKNKQGKYDYVGEKNVIFVTEDQSTKMVSIEPQEFIGYCRDIHYPLYSKQGLFLEWDDELKEIYRKAGQSPWEISTIFYEVEDLHKNLLREMEPEKHLIIGDFSDECIAIIENYFKVLIYGIENDQVVFKSSFSIVDREDDSILDVCLDNTGNAYCRLEDDSVVSVDMSTGKVQQEYNWIPGLIIAGCDFRGAVAEEGVKAILKDHGGKF